MKGTPWEIDHIFVLVAPGAPEAAKLEKLGLVRGGGRDHPGQGTSNICFFFSNAYLELLFTNQADPVSSDAVRRTGLMTRANWRENGSSPFGISVRGGGNGNPLPVDHWDYEAPYGLTIPVALFSEDSHQPFIFLSPGKTRPDQWEREIPFQPGLDEITSLTLELPTGINPAADLSRLQEMGWIDVIENAPAHRLILGLSDGTGAVACHLSLPDFEWV